MVVDRHDRSHVAMSAFAESKEPAETWPAHEWRDRLDALISAAQKAGVSSRSIAEATPRQGRSAGNRSRNLRAGRHNAAMTPIRAEIIGFDRAETEGHIRGRQASRSPRALSMPRATSQSTLCTDECLFRLIHRAAEATRIIASNGSKIFRFEIDGRFFAEVIEVSC